MRRALAALAIAFLAGCGGGDDAPDKLTLALDFTPNAAHAPLYAAADAGAFDIQVPGQGPNSLKLVLSGRADVGVLDIHDLAIARAEGADIVAFGALVDRPLAALAARAGGGISRPRDLEGRTVGVSGLPSDPAFLDAVVADDGGDPSKVEQVTIGFTAVTRLLSGRVDAAPIFWNVEGVILRRRGLDLREFRVDDYGAPRYPELVLIAKPDRVDELEPVLEAIQDGIETARADPQASAERIAEAEGAGDVDLIRAQVDAISGAWDVGLDRDDPGRVVGLRRPSRHSGRGTRRAERLRLLPHPVIEPPDRKTLLMIGTTLFIIAMMAAILAPPKEKDEPAPQPTPSGETRTYDPR